MPSPLLTIGELSKRTGVAPSALRYYEHLGLMPRAARASGQRRYETSAVQLVGMILLFRDVGFSLAETKTLLSSRPQAPDTWLELHRRKLAELDEHIERAQAARVALQHAVRCTHEDHLDCPNFAAIVTARLAGKPLKDAHADADRPAPTAR